MIQELVSYAIGTLAALFPIANPLGAIPIFFSLTLQDTPSFRHRQAQRTAINVSLILAIFLIAGKLILAFFGISLGVLQIAGGLIVSHTAWEMVTARQRLTNAEHQEATDKEDISFTPMALPLISGPGAIGLIISLAERSQTLTNYLGCLLGIALLGITIYLCLALGEPLVRILGKNGLGAMNRIFGFFILGIAVQLIADGAITFIRQSAPGLLH
jgi:multiple antibiotic resistance protein